MYSGSLFTVWSPKQALIQHLYRCAVLDILCKWSHVMCSILCQASFTLHGVFEEDLCVALISASFLFSANMCYKYE